MPHSFSTSDDGKRFQIVLAGGGGSYEADLNEFAFGEDQFVQLQNAVPHIRGVFAKRPGMPYAVTADHTVSNINTSATQADLILFPGSKRYATASALVGLQPYYGFDNATSGSCYVQFAQSASGTVVRTGIGGIFPVGTPTFIDDSVIQGQLDSNGVINYSIKLAGTVHAQYTGTATLTANSASVTVIDAALTTAQQTQVLGSWLVATGDSNSTLAVYRIVAVVSSTEVTLDRVFNGSSAGAAAAIRISACEAVRVTSGLFESGNSVGGFTLSVSAWGRLVVACARGGGLNIALAVSERNNRAIRWSGLVGSTTEGTTPFVGISGFHADGWIDAPSRGGAIRQLVNLDNALAMFQDHVLTIIRGEPDFDGAGTLDFTEQYNINFSGSDDGSAVYTPYGLFYFDRSEGLMLYTSGTPVSVSKGRINTVSGLLSWAMELTYHNGYIIMSSVAAGDSPWHVYHVESDSFAYYPSTGLNVGLDAITKIQPGRGSVETINYAPSGERLVGLAKGRAIVEVGTIFAYPREVVLGYDYDAEIVQLIIETPFLGDPSMDLSPRRAHVTYRTTEIASGANNPWLRLTLEGGLTANPAEGYSFVSRANDFPETSGEWVTRTVELPATLRAPMLKITVESRNQAAEFQVARVLIEGDVEGTVVDTGSERYRRA